MSNEGRRRGHTCCMMCLSIFLFGLWWSLALAVSRVASSVNNRLMDSLNVEVSLKRCNIKPTVSQCLWPDLCIDSQLVLL